MPELPTDNDVQYVLDGGALLQLIPWSRGSTFASILQSYVCYVTQRFQQAVVVFDGYLSGPSTKGIPHQRKTKGKSSVEVVFTLHMTLQTKKDFFLSNKKNKQRFIDFLCEALTKNSCTTVCADGDADCMIVAQALESSKSKTTVVVGDDTDLLVLLCYHACHSDTHHDIFLRPSHRVSAKTMKWWNMKHTRQSIENLCQILPVIHAITGCDTTSRPFGAGKRNAFNKFLKSENLRTLASVFLTESAPAHIIEAGEKILIALYETSCGQLG